MMSPTYPSIAPFVPVVAFAISALLTLVLVRVPGMFARMLDEPNARSLHSGSIPRTGGMAVLTGATCAALLAWALLGLSPDWLWIAAAVIPVAVVSLLDDRGDVRPSYRLAAHLTAALLLTVGGNAWSLLELPGMAIPMGSALAFILTLVYVVWMINLYNFMDGMDGLAGGMAVLGFGALAVLGWRAGDLSFAVLAAAVAASAGGFLLGNLPPARIFLGDLGSASLGLLAAALTLLGSRRGLFPLWVAWIAFSPFLVDATWTLLRRAIRGERVWEAHRSHHYQRLVLAGWSHRMTLVRAYLLMIAAAACAVAAPNMPVQEQWWLLAIWALIYFLVGYRTRLVERDAGRTAP